MLAQIQPVVMIVLAASVLFELEAPAQEPGEAKDRPPEDRLLEAELLEVSAGDLEKAMAVYRALAEDEKTSEPIRARALLYLARSQRKRGELEGAKKTLEALVKAHAAERQIIRQAQGFLRELQGGRAENPDFDWLRDLEKNPEIQARVFDLAMDLMSPEESKAGTARRQLRALGAAAVPVLERVLEVSRDARQRQWLAAILVSLGRYERVGSILDPARPPDWYQNRPETDLFYQIEVLSEEGRKDLIRAIDKLAPAPEIEGARSLFLLFASDARDIPGRLRAVEGIPRWSKEPRTSVALPAAGPIRHCLDRLAARDPAAADAMARRMLEPDCPLHVQDDYVDALLGTAPAKLGADHWASYLELCFRAPPVPQGRGLKTVEQRLSHLLETERFDALLRLASGPVAGHLDEVFRKHWIDSRKVRSASPRWGKVLRAARAAGSLLLLAEARDEVIPEWVGFLQGREQEAPDLTGSGLEHLGLRLEDWQPSAAYLEAAVGLLEAKDPVAAAIAVETLSLAPERNPPGAAERIARLARESGDGHVREFALYALLRGFAMDSSPGVADAGALLAEHEARAEATEAPESYRSSPLADVGILGSVVRHSTPPRPPRTVGVGPRAKVVPKAPGVNETPYAYSLDWLLELGGGWTIAFYPHVLGAADSAAGARGHRWYRSKIQTRWSGFVEPMARVLAGRLEAIRSPELMAEAVEVLPAGIPPYPLEGNAGARPGKGVALTPATPPQLLEGNKPPADDIKDLQAKVLAFFRRIAADSMLPLDMRLAACAWARDQCFSWFDWPALFRTQETLVPGLLELRFPNDNPVREAPSFAGRFRDWVDKLPAEKQDALYGAAIASPREEVQIWALQHYPGDRKDVPEVFRKATHDPSRQVRQAAVDRLQHFSRADLGPLWVELLAHPDEWTRLEVVRRLPRFAGVESIEPLTKMLDDPNTAVRDIALEALKKVRSALEERKEWQELVKKLKEDKKP